MVLVINTDLWMLWREKMVLRYHARCAHPASVPMSDLNRWSPAATADSISDGRIESAPKAAALGQAWQADGSTIDGPRLLQLRLRLLLLHARTHSRLAGLWLSPS
jgi:hypothetical protein